MYTTGYILTILWHISRHVLATTVNKVKDSIKLVLNSNPLAYCSIYLISVIVNTPHSKTHIIQ